MITNALVVGGLTLLVGVLAALGLRALPSVRLQLAGLALVAVTLPLAAVLLSGSVMLHMGAEAELAAIALAAGVAGVVGALVVARSITTHLERVRAASVRLAGGELGERAPEGGPSEIAELASSFNSMAEHLEEVFDSRRQLVAWASHDLRAPITSLRAMLEAIEDGVVEPTHYLGALQSQVRLLAAMVDALFELACIDAGATALEVEDVDMVALLTSCMHRFELEADAKGVRIIPVLRDRLATARCAPDKVERVLANLVTNSLRYTPVGGTITLSLTRAAGSVFVSVEDTGAGIAPESIERVFEPFFRADVARTPESGSAGLGLAIARGLIDAQGGRIWAENPSSGGTRICFVLPAPDDEAPLSRSAGPTRRHAGIEGPGATASAERSVNPVD